MDYFAITTDEDSRSCKILWEAPVSKNRKVRVSTSKLEDRNYAQIKLFKLGHNTWRKYSEIWMNRYEVDRFFNSLNVYKYDISSLLQNEKENLPSLPPKFHVTPEEDADYCHWFKGVTNGKFRKLRISLVTYDNFNPQGTTYIQLKIFKERNGQFIKHSQVSLTLAEFTELCENSDYLKTEFKNIL